MSKATRRTALTVGASLMAAPAIVRAEQKSWRMVTSWPKNLPGPGITAQRLADRITSLSNGELTVELHSAGEIVPAFEVLDAVGSEVAELGHTAAVFWSGKMPAAPFFLAVPFGLTPLEHIAWIEHGGGQALWDELYAEFSVKPFMAGNTGMSMGGWFKKELNSVGDLRGLKYRMPGLGGEMYRPMGVVQVSIPPGEILPALQSGAIDAAEFAGPSSDLALGFYKAAPFYYYPGLHEPNGTGECLVNRAAYDGLNDQLKSVIAHACAAENAFALAEAEQRNAAALDALANKHGAQLRHFPEDIIKATRESAADILANFASMGGIEARISNSYEIAKASLGNWSAESIKPFLEARG